MKKEEIFWFVITCICVAILKQILGFETTVLGFLIVLGFKD